MNPICPAAIIFLCSFPCWFHYSVLSLLLDNFKGSIFCVLIWPCQSLLTVCFQMFTVRSEHTTQNFPPEPSHGNFNCLIILWSLLPKFLCAHPPKLITQDSLFSNLYSACHTLQQLNCDLKISSWDLSCCWFQSPSQAHFSKPPPQVTLRESTQANCSGLFFFELHSIFCSYQPHFSSSNPLLVLAALLFLKPHPEVSSALFTAAYWSGQFVFQLNTTIHLKRHSRDSLLLSLVSTAGTCSLLRPCYLQQTCSEQWMEGKKKGNNKWWINFSNLPPNNQLNHL